MSIEADVLELQRKASLLETLPAAGLSTINLAVGAAILSGATNVAVQTHHQAISFADAAVQSAYWSLWLPPGWAGRTLVVKMLWAPSTTNTGTVFWLANIYREAAGVTLTNVADDFLSAAPAGNGTADQPQAVTWTGALGLTAFAAGEALSLEIRRNGTDAGFDTFTGAARLLALELSVTG